jgi:hypothetical protein
MDNIVAELFHDHGFVSQEVKPLKGYLFSPGRPLTQKAFWLVLHEAKIDSILLRQPDLFEACKAVCRDDALDKNISLLLLWNTGGRLPLGALKRKVMAVEEDPFFFKKYVLYYSDFEADRLRQEIRNMPVTQFISREVCLPDNFSIYREEPVAQNNWRPLLYRIVMKLPFVEIPLGASGDLESLFESNQTHLENKNLKEFDTRVWGILEERVPSVDEINPADLLGMLLPAVGEPSDDR